MPKYRFLRTARDERRNRTFEEGQEYDLTPASGRHWTDRFVAVPVDEKPRSQPKATSAGPTQVGADESRARPYVEDDTVSAGARPDAMTTAEVSAPKEGAPENDPYEGMTREELLEQAEARGLDFGSGYVSKSRLLKALRTGDTSE